MHAEFRRLCATSAAAVTVIAVPWLELRPSANLPGAAPPDANPCKPHDHSSGRARGRRNAPGPQRIRKDVSGPV